MDINELYGAGSASAFMVALDPPAPLTMTAQQFSARRGTAVKAVIKWFDGPFEAGEMKVLCMQDYAHFANLHLEPAYRNRGIYTRLVKRLCDYLEERGVTYLTASPANAYSSWILQLAGFVPDGEGRIRCDIGPGSRRKEYIAWKEGSMAEPEWHAQLKAFPPNLQPSNGLPWPDD